VKTSHIII